MDSIYNLLIIASFPWVKDHAFDTYMEQSGVAKWSISSFVLL